MSMRHLTWTNSPTCHMQALVAASGADLRECEDFITDVVSSVEGCSVLVCTPSSPMNVLGGMMVHGSLNLSSGTGAAPLVDEDGNLFMRPTIILIHRNKHYLAQYPVGEDGSGDITILVDRADLGKKHNALGFIVPNELVHDSDYVRMPAAEVADDVEKGREDKGLDVASPEGMRAPCACVVACGEVC
jgi:hypothetical protein